MIGVDRDVNHRHIRCSICILYQSQSAIYKINFRFMLLLYYIISNNNIYSGLSSTGMFIILYNNRIGVVQKYQHQRVRNSKHLPILFLLYSYHNIYCTGTLSINHCPSVRCRKRKKNNVVLFKLLSKWPADILKTTTTRFS